ncbi:MAG: hypothetical protein LBH18_07330 [Spirochaetaceae bacterium]|jgi:hypothetical protein|nr:hypothetical protein [Spirochaetaceae bacterium]
MYGSFGRARLPTLANCGIRVFRSKTMEVFNYNEEDRGKRVFYAACYENAKGEAGHWSDIVEAVIP